MLITITTAGLAALVNAQNNGTLPVLVAEIGVTSTAFVPGAALLALPGEIKRLSTFSGQAVADDTIHVTIRDDSADAYSMRGFGLYLADGTLFAVHGQADPMLEKSPQAMLLLSADIRFVQIEAASLTFGDANWMNPPATALVAGVVELATPVEASAGTDAQRAVTPAGVKHSIDERFGAGAPAAFIRTLLTLASEALVRDALSIKAAALRDEGHGNGLDSDTLDGEHGEYYRAWENLTGIPGAFPPSAHGHDISDITGAEAKIIAAIKSSTTSVPLGTTTLMDDPHLVVTVPTAGLYLIDAVLYCRTNVNAGAGVQFRFSHSSGNLPVNTASLHVHGVANDIPFDFGWFNGNGSVAIPDARGNWVTTVRVGGTISFPVGTFRVRYAEFGVSGANVPLQIHINSYLTIKKIQ